MENWHFVRHCLPLSFMTDVPPYSYSKSFRIATYISRSLFYRCENFVELNSAKTPPSNAGRVIACDIDGMNASQRTQSLLNSSFMGAALLWHYCPRDGCRMHTKTDLCGAMNITSHAQSWLYRKSNFVPTISNHGHTGEGEFIRAIPPTFNGPQGKQERSARWLKYP